MLQPHPFPSLRLSGSRRLSALLLLTFGSLGAAWAQEQAVDPSSYLTPGVARVGDRLACRCGGCRNTVGNCPMIRCGSADPKRQRIAALQASGMNDDAIISRFVQEEGAVSLSSPPVGSLGGIVTWTMPGIALLVGLLIYLRFIRSHRSAAPAGISEHERAAMERFHAQIDRDFEDQPR